CVWAGTWNITFTPMQTADTPPMPVYSWTPPSSSVLFGGVVTCTGGDITFDTSNGVFPLPGADPSQAFVQFDNLFESPSSIGVTVTPTGGSDATCALNARP